MDRTILLVDDHDVLYRSGTRRVLHPLRRHPANPLIINRDKLWEVEIGWMSVYRNPESGRYQLWYQAYSSRAKEPTNCPVCYAESDDGIAWVKPELDLFPFHGIVKTNIVLVGNAGTSLRYGASVLVDPLDRDASHRYKMAYFDFAVDNGKEYPGLCVAFSPDGIHWKKHSKAPLLRSAYSGLGAQLPYKDEPRTEWHVPLSMSDALDTLYDPRIGKFAMYGKMWIDGPDGKENWKHAMGRTESKDFIHWSTPELVLNSDDLDPAYVEFHTASVFYYNDCYFGLLQILNRGLDGGVIDVELAVSRDGRNWRRPFRSPFFLPRNPDGGFDCRTILTNSTPVLLEDEFRFYYGAIDEGATSGDNNKNVSGIGLATMPRDRFAGVRPIEKTGQITLRPQDFSGVRQISLNADATGGELRAELLTEDGYRVRGYTKEDATPIRENSLRHAISWKEKRLADLPPGRYLLRLYLNNAELFAVMLAGKSSQSPNVK